MKNIPPTKVSFDICYSLYIFSPCLPPPPPQSVPVAFWWSFKYRAHSHSLRLHSSCSILSFLSLSHFWFVFVFFFFFLCYFIQNCYHCVEYLLRLFTLLLFSERKLITGQIKKNMENINLGIGHLFCYSNDCQVGQYWPEQFIFLRKVGSFLFKRYQWLCSAFVSKQLIWNRSSLYD